jgi:hypothetical protein
VEGVISAARAQPLAVQRAVWAHVKDGVQGLAAQCAAGTASPAATAAALHLLASCLETLPSLLSASQGSGFVESSVGAVLSAMAARSLNYSSRASLQTAVSLLDLTALLARDRRLGQNLVETLVRLVTETIAPMAGP